MMNKREPCSVSHLPPPVRKPPARVLRDWENPPPFSLVERHIPIWSCDWSRPRTRTHCTKRRWKWKLKLKLGKRPMSHDHAKQRARMTARHIALAAIMLALLGCSDTQDETSAPEAMPGEVMEPATASYSDSDNNNDNDEDAASDEDDQANPEPPRFMGSPCTDDCSGHEAGYQWAEEKDIDDPDDCSGNSNSFVEGCKAFRRVSR